MLCDKAFNIAKNLKYDGYQRGPTLLVSIFFGKKSSSANTSGSAVTCAWSETVERQDKSTIENKVFSNQELAK